MNLRPAVLRDVTEQTWFRNGQGSRTARTAAALHFTVTCSSDRAVMTTGANRLMPEDV